MKRTKPSQIKRRRYPNAISATRRASLVLYAQVRVKFKQEHPRCECCHLIHGRAPRKTDDIHHTRGRIGRLLTMTRFFKAACRDCHIWIDDHPDLARGLGLLCEKGQWNTVPEGEE